MNYVKITKTHLLPLLWQIQKEKIKNNTFRAITHKKEINKRNPN